MAPGKQPTPTTGAGFAVDPAALAGFQRELTDLATELHALKAQSPGAAPATGTGTAAGATTAGANAGSPSGPGQNSTLLVGNYDYIGLIGEAQRLQEDYGTKSAQAVDDLTLLVDALHVLAAVAGDIHSGYKTAADFENSSVDAINQLFTNRSKATQSDAAPPSPALPTTPTSPA